MHRDKIDDGGGFPKSSGGGGVKGAPPNGQVNNFPGFPKLLIFQNFLK